MTEDTDLERFVRDPSLLIEFCRRVIGQIHTGSKNAEVGEKETQLREISRTIERLKKAGVAIPDGLRAEKTRLAAEFGTQTETSQTMNFLADEFEKIVKDLNVRLGKVARSSTAKKVQYKHSSSPKTHQKVYREHIISSKR